LWDAISHKSAHIREAIYLLLVEEISVKEGETSEINR
jgi:hypothetical protein